MPFFEPITACALTLACLASPAHHAGSSLELRMAYMNGTTSTVSLDCQPAGGTHPHSEHACAELAAVNGDFNRLRPHLTTPCTYLYQPVDVAADGNWLGRPVAFAATYGNPCMADVGSNGIFHF
jgi:hypothetical protein